MYIIAIDGPAASGKSSVAKIIASRLGFSYLDTGAMYRAYTLYCLENKIDVNDKDEVEKYVNNIMISFHKTKIYMNSKDVTLEIRSNEVTSNVSVVCAYPKVREYMVNEQRRIAKEDKNGVVLDGRDIGTVVFPNANLKIFLEADYTTRALRRMEDNKKLNIQKSLEETIEDLKIRDKKDSTREHSPLCKASDAITIDNSSMTLEETADKIIGLIR